MTLIYIYLCVYIYKNILLIFIFWILAYMVWFGQFNWSTPKSNHGGWAWLGLVWFSCCFGSCPCLFWYHQTLNRFLKEKKIWIDSFYTSYEIYFISQGIAVLTSCLRGFCMNILIISLFISWKVNLLTQGLKNLQ